MKHKFSLLFLTLFSLCTFCSNLFAQKQSSSAINAELNNRKKYLAVQMEWAEDSDYFLVKTTVNNKGGYMLLDTGAATTSFTIAGAKALGLKLSQGKGALSGLGGKLKVYQTKVNKLVFGGTFGMQNTSVRVLNLALLNNTKRFGQKVPFGILGSDTLKKVGAVVDYRAGKIYIPLAKNLNLPSIAQKDGYSRLDMIKSNLPIAMVKIGKKNMRMCFDSGAARTVVSKRLADSGVLKVYEDRTKVRGADGKLQQTSVIHVPNLSFGSLQFIDFGASVISLKPLSYYDIDGIIGFELMRPGAVIMDYGQNCILTPKLKIGAADLGTPGPLPIRPEALKKRIKNSEFIASGKITNLRRLLSFKAGNGTIYDKIKISFTAQKVYKGKAKVNQNIDLTVVYPKTGKLDPLKALAKKLKSGSKFMVLKPKSKGEQLTAFSSVFYKDSGIRQAQMESLIKKKK